jgi:predicted Zn-dependent protease
MKIEWLAAFFLVVVLAIAVFAHPAKGEPYFEPVKKYQAGGIVSITPVNKFTRLHVWYFDGPEALGYREAQAVSTSAVREYKKIKVGLQIQRFSRNRGMFRNGTVLGSQEAVHGRVAAYIWRKTKIHNAIVHAMVPPFYDDPDYYILGLAWQSGIYELGVDDSVTSMCANLKERALEAKYCMLHELGHTFGAPHREDCSVMDTALFECISNGVIPVWNQDSINMIRFTQRCYGKNYCEATF